jgi:hypothetical protein
MELLKDKMSIHLLSPAVRKPNNTADSKYGC